MLDLTNFLGYLCRFQRSTTRSLKEISSRLDMDKVLGVVFNERA